MITNKTKSCDSIRHKFDTEAPSTLRMPISLVRCSATNDANPNKPRQEINTARMAKKVASSPIRFSLPNLRAYSSSTNAASKGVAGLILLKTSSILLMASLYTRLRVDLQEKNILPFIGQMPHGGTNGLIR